MGSASSRRGDAEGLPSLLQAAAAPGHAPPPAPPARAPAPAPARRPPPSSVRIPLRSEPTLDSEADADGDAASAPALTELQEIQDLEKTFDSLGIPLKVDDNANVSGTESFRYQSPNHDDDNPKPEESMKCEVSVLLESIPDTPEKFTLNGIQPVNSKLAPSLHRQSDIGIKINDSITVTPRTNQQSSEISSEEDWSYSQKDIEGFDVEKFRKANRKVIDANDTFSISLIRKNKSTTLHPLHFPSYDSTEEQLLAGIEEEFGS